MKWRAKIRDWLASRAWLQLLALAIAMIAWLFVNSGRNLAERRSLRIQYVQIPKGLSFQKTPPREAKLTLTGPLYRLRTIRDDDLAYLVDLSNAHAGSQRLELELDSLRLPIEVEASQVNPRSFVLHLEEMATRNVPVKAQFIGNPKSGFSVIKSKVSPEIVTVSGPRSVISKIENLEVEVPISGRDSSFSISVQPKNNFPETEVSETILAEVEIGTLKVSRDLENIPVVLEGVGDRNIQVSPDHARVKIEAPQENSIQLSSQVKVIIATEGLKRGRYRLRGRVQLPDGVNLVSVIPENFIVEVLP